ncbi:MAG: CoA transferase [Castellaniella sp.]|uniref:CaiB/BaiF CoA transferase family protein n=1 Tax=Castellaniella sp. TaxID=1955812 RepID=UPI001222B408|nr:CaiB/BaiF CoA-transferase family protein [Castellaniella sp.]TAN27226.1 MAG: CoA transferase [Castellaniella sp.]
MNDDMLNGMKVLGLCHYLQGPAATQYLADLGADVIKIEPIAGAHERHWAGADSFIDGVSSFFLCANRNKRSLAVDLKTPEGRDIVERLIARSDAVVENFRPGVLDRLGFGYERAREINPALIYASATGFGASGPMRDSPGQDLLVQARCGLVAGTGERFTAPKAVGAAVVDQHGGALLAMAVVAAYVRKLTSGRGARVESSLFNAGLDLQAEALAAYINAGVERDRYRRHPDLATWFHEAPYGVYRTRDDRFVVIGLNDPVLLAQTLNSSRLMSLAECNRYEDRDVYAAAVAEAVLGFDFGDFSARFDQSGLWYAPVQDYADLQVDPQALHNEVFETIETGGLRFTLLNAAVRYDGKKLPTRRFALAAGADTHAILSDLGMDAAQIDDLVARRVVAAPPDPASDTVRTRPFAGALHE